MNAQTFVTPSGETMVVLSEADYLKLIAAAEEAVDAAAVRQFKEQLAKGEEEMLPAAMADRMLAGESPVRVWREHRGLTAHDLAALAGTSQPYLSQIENGKREGGIETMKKLASALGVTIDDIV
ncbi:helix-turn-helix transcriptional regulator [Xanthobacter autotrophicus]|uniref:helix-turn-helix domain-containing protein n=1 Tax=Xanthobacter autotrophicus TaxID=280 RepID=UPI003726901C